MGYSEEDYLHEIDFNYGILAKYQNQFDDFIVAIGNPGSCRAVAEKVRGAFNLATLIHPTAVISKYRELFIR